MTRQEIHDNRHRTLVRNGSIKGNDSGAGIRGIIRMHPLLRRNKSPFSREILPEKECFSSRTQKHLSISGRRHGFRAELPAYNSAGLHTRQRIRDPQGAVGTQLQLAQDLLRILPVEARQIQETLFRRADTEFRASVDKLRMAVDPKDAVAFRPDAEDVPAVALLTAVPQ